MVNLNYLKLMLYGNPFGLLGSEYIGSGIGSLNKLNCLEISLASNELDDDDIE